ncbi:hypothetical protein HHI36_017072 [Cryptolaemus montrouzieri]|uniref:Uncharacterized protein n=1 Tax=Cryptolaemus montrouzieri TaxID=559131 RepID=A0ABD2NLS0_9CUCU
MIFQHNGCHNRLSVKKLVYENFQTGGLAKGINLLAIQEPKFNTIVLLCLRAQPVPNSEEFRERIIGMANTISNALSAVFVTTPPTPSAAPLPRPGSGECDEKNQIHGCGGFK